VLKHEQFEEICAAAAIGQASPEELAELERHASECDACRQEYAECLGMAARQFATAERHLELSQQEALNCLNSEMLTKRFFERAEREGIVFSKATSDIPPFLISFRRRPVWRIPVFSAAAACLIILGSTYFVKRGTQPVHHAESRLPDNPLVLPPSAGDLDRNLDGLKAANSKLESQLQQLTQEVRIADRQLSKADSDLKATTEDRQRLASERDTLAAQLQDLQRKLADSEALAAMAQQQSSRFRDRDDELQASLVADQTRIRELTEQASDKAAALDRERQLLALGHDVSDLMGARNLHIVDVVDTDSHGRTRPAFGRIFFTEGKSLVFYAYDLNDAKMEKANYQYRIWSKKEGQDPRVKSLGIFYSDDKAQRRWVFKCSDPKVLSEIDSVFVTLEPVNGDPARPKGSNLMYAYLRGQPNHP
jgi:hypothetical protein